MLQGIGIKGKEMALIWHKKARRTALQMSSVFLTHTLLYRHTHMMFPPPPAMLSNVSNKIIFFEDSK